MIQYFSGFRLWENIERWIRPEIVAELRVIMTTVVIDESGKVYDLGEGEHPITKTKRIKKGSSYSYQPSGKNAANAFTCGKGHAVRMKRRRAK